MTRKHVGNLVGLVLLAAVLCLWGQHTRPNQHQELSYIGHGAVLPLPAQTCDDLQFNAPGVALASAQYGGPTKAEILDQVSQLVDYGQFRRELESMDFQPGGLRNQDYVAQQLWITAVQTYADRFEHRLRQGVAANIFEAWVDRAGDFTVLEQNLNSRYQELLSLYDSHDLRNARELRPRHRFGNQTDPPGSRV